MERNEKTLTKKSEEELDAILEKYNVSKTDRGYRFLRQTIAMSYLRPGMKFNDIYEELSSITGKSPSAVHMYVVRQVGKISKENGRKWSISDFVNLCINNMSSYGI